MPTYDYECTSCNKVIEIFQQMSDPPLQKCPECGKKIKRLIGGGLGVIFKGDGFYVTDSKKKNNDFSPHTGKKAASDSCSTCSAPACPTTEKK